MKLPPSDWTERRGLAALIGALDGKARFVGGAVRDSLLGVAVKDVDLATPLLPEDVMKRLTAASIKVIPTGIDHGTVTAVLPDGPVEITTLRRDVSTDGRRATVAFSDDWQEDAARRDFTINALSADPETLEIFDYFGGLDDLEQRRISFIGSAAERIAEDHLRIMRYFRFLARFGLHELDSEAFQACVDAAPKLEQLSRERIADELLKLLATDDPRMAVGKMLDGKIFEHIVAETDAHARVILDRLVRREKAHDIVPGAVRRLVALLPKDWDTQSAIAKSLKFSKKLQKAIVERAPLQGDTNVRALAYRTSVEAARDVALLFADDAALPEMLADLKNWQPPILPMSGGDLIERGLKPGPIVARTLATIEQAWIDNSFPDEKWVTEFVDGLDFSART
ncbi:MAG: CCA tRNA nucleotidyltransferase [Sphingomonadales bacterium]|nr:CCA tRNA nucleotidyltransferase [Sphingomonadales bacterium]PIX67585.1 MAG: polynucleotide adenylyltransferase [Sphingomonadales bacterium CG_4_10_14_3_um_filter_58_15]NCO49333.1 CCA tRNA nucleotidyltransferase [Sphingomonadales bacterium]NCO99505.1 CCA tRNA nucleotidyltransferase [Sphingomonadales bacterium]NCP27785.1 CCA tRNA nucleotidyltransferase [Sphingomonadales bacterium]